MAADRDRHRDRIVAEFWANMQAAAERFPSLDPYVRTQPMAGQPLLATYPIRDWVPDPDPPRGAPAPEAAPGGRTVGMGDALAKGAAAAATMAARELARPERRAFWGAWCVTLAYCGHRGVPFLPSLVAAELAGAGASMAWRASADLRAIRAGLDAQAGGR